MPVNVADFEREFIIAQTSAAALYTTMLEMAIEDISENIPDDAEATPEFLTTVSAAGMALASIRKFGEIAACAANSLGLSDTIRENLRAATSRQQ